MKLLSECNTKGGWGGDAAFDSMSLLNLVSISKYLLTVSGRVDIVLRGVGLPRDIGREVWWLVVGLFLGSYLALLVWGTCCGTTARWSGFRKSGCISIGSAVLRLFC
jgi:hypothetical protein